MNKTDNPYKGLVALGKLLARGAAMQPTMGIGIIVSPPPEIKIKYNGFTLDKQFLYIDEYWIQGIQGPIRAISSAKRSQERVAVAMRSLNHIPMISTTTTTMWKR
jgi:hypothetical protein